MTGPFPFDYELPPERIAQEPLAPRDASRLMVVRRQTGERFHVRFSDLPAWLAAGDLLVLNDTRVIPTRLAARRRTGARLDMILVRELAPGRWTAMIQGARRVKSGETVLAGPIVDQAALHGVLAKIRDLGLPLLAVQRVTNQGGE